MNPKLIKLVNALKTMKPLEQTGGRKRFRVIASVLDKKGRTIATRCNDYNCTHPVQKRYAVKAGRPEAEMLHAEIASIIAAKGKSIHTVLIARVDANGNPVPAVPCEICSLAMQEIGVKEIIHT